MNGQLHHHGDDGAEVPGPPAPAHEYRFDFLFHRSPTVEIATLQSLLAESFRGVEISTAGSGTVIELDWGESRERLTISSVDIDRETLPVSIEQSWQWRDAGTVAHLATHALRLTHHLGGEMSLEGRIAFLRKLVSVMIQYLSPAAVHLVETSQLMDPSNLHEAFVEDPYDPLYGFMNIRLYKVEGHERGITARYDETIMDTLGLHALGLPDLQMHFKHLDASMVARLLDDTAHYLIEKGAVIEAGHSIRGFADGQKFACTFEGSILDPWRLVIEIDPGKPYSLKSSVDSIVT